MYVAWFLLLQFYFVLDAVDGMIARYRKMANPIGKYFDIMAPIVVIPVSLIGMTYGVYLDLLNPIIFLLGFISVTFFLAGAV